MTEQKPSPPTRGLAPLPLIALAVLLVGAVFFWIYRLGDGNEAGGPRDPGAPLPVAEGYTLGGDFSLVDQDGVAATPARFAGQYMLVFFGYSFCPDICPTELGNVAVAIDALAEIDAEQAARVVPIFITVDPARDTVEVLREYVRLFHPRMVGLTGSEEEIARAVGAYRVLAQRGEEIGGDVDEGHYLMDHSALTYFMGPDGAFIAMFGRGFEPRGAAASMNRLMVQHDG